VLFVGIADAAKNYEGKVESYKHLKELRNAQQELALQYGFAYFDLFEAMGGEGTIIDWTKSNPPLALTDYVHFSRHGGEKAANFITKALWHQLDQLNHHQDSFLVAIDTLKVWDNY
jgi:lysophospholipase L1-like esterase